MYRLSGERVVLDLDGPSVEVEPIRSWMIQYEVLTLVGRVEAATSSASEYVALSNLYDMVAREMQPTWDIGDHLGAVPNTPRGFARLPLDVMSAITDAWLETLNAKEELPEIPGLHVVESDAPSAVDEVIPPGPFNREVKKRLRRARAA
jgi:hypothetical protein